MVDKIDRSEAPPAYFITRPKDAKESQHQQKEQGDEQEQRRKQETSEKAWSKFDRRTTVIRPLRAERDTIARCLFRTVVLHSGVGTLQIDVVWKDGRTTNGALVLLARLEDFFRLKKFAAGQEVPEEFWARGAHVELGIIEVLSPGGPQERRDGGYRGAAAPETPRQRSLLEHLRIVDPTSKRVRWGVVAAWLIFAAIAAFAVVAAVR